MNKTDGRLVNMESSRGQERQKGLLLSRLVMFGGYLELGSMNLVFGCSCFHVRQRVLVD
ncbi:MAG: hypothetical protein ACE5HS_05660 [bacterium]